MLEARNVRKVYHTGSAELCVLKGINLSVSRGDFLSIVGPSGAGKSTLLHILGGLDEPTEGNVYLDDFCLSTLSDTQRAGIRNSRFGFVFQFYHLLHEFSALENVMLPALIKKDSVKKKAVREKAFSLLEFLGLSERFQHKPSELSGGEQQRVAIARALINDPEVLFCDEPTGNLDSQSGLQIRDMLVDLNRRKGTTVVLVTHSRELAQGSRRILNIFDGKIVSSEEIQMSAG